MNKRKSIEEYRKEVFSLVGNEYQILEGEIYINNKEKIGMKHNCEKCNGFEFKMRPNDFLNGHRCPKCSGLMKKTMSQFKQEVFELVGDEYIVLGEYLNNRTYVLMKHDICKYEYKVKPNDFLNGNRCPRCGGKERKTTERFKEQVLELVGNEYTVLGEYTHSLTKLQMKHNLCGNIYSVKPSDFLSGHRCPKCAAQEISRKKRKTDFKFRQEVFELVGNEYTVLEEYINDGEKIGIRHNCERCNNYEFKMRPNCFLRGQRCPVCNSSRGEKKIAYTLNKTENSFQKEYKFLDCKNKRPLPFDFALFDKKGNVKMLIEYQGIQHYYYSDYFYSGEADFIDRIIKDSIKRAYCEYNNIPLLEIDYLSYDEIELILNRKLGDLHTYS